ncbi:MAG TPA: GH3 auxin-responsive promoter family protein [Polyangiaceae bacterium]|jgi:hypothetical protein
MGLSSRLVLGALGTGHAASLSAAAARFERARRHPREAQEALLRGFLRRNALTAYGRAHRFSTIETVAEYQRSVPVVDYEALAPYVERIADGEPNVLTASPVKMLERSSGSSSARKMIPYTAELLAEFSAATGPWLFDLYRRRPRLFGTSSYWSVSPAAREAERTRGGVRIGFEDDTEYFGPITRWALGKMLAVPSSVARIPDMDAWRRETALRLLAAEDLGLLSVWSPTFLTLLLRYMEKEIHRLLPELPAGRRARLERAIGARGFVGDAIWPHLVLVSSWADGDAASFVPALRAYFPRTEIQPKGLLATEGVVSFPLLGLDGPLAGAGVAAAASHFLEFLPEGGTRPLLCDELRAGDLYSPILTTGAGFARYHLKDRVRCVGHHDALPLLRFEGKLDRISDVCGEKLHAAEVERAIRGAAEELALVPDFALLAPSASDPPRYELFVEAAADDATLARLAERVERTLRAGHHYRYCRDLGQLESVRAVPVREGHARFERALVERGGKAGDIKPTHLDSRRIWGDVFR